MGFLGTLRPVIALVPVHKPGDADLERRIRFEAHGLVEGGGVGKRRGHVPRLHRHELDLGFFPEARFQDLNVSHEVDRLAVADVVDPVRGVAPRRIGRIAPPRGIARRRPIDDGDDAFHDVVDVGKVPPHAAVVEDLDRFATQNFGSELEKRHVRAAPGSIDRKKAKPGALKAIQVGVAVGHQLVRFLGRRVQGHRVIDVVAFGERELGIGAVHRAGGGKDEVPHPAVAAALEHVGEADEVGIDVGIGVLDRVAHPRLGGQVKDPVETVRGKEFRHACPVRHVELLEDEVLVRAQAREAGFLQGHIVVGVEVVDAVDRVAAVEQSFRDRRADESRGARNQDVHIGESAIRGAPA